MPSTTLATWPATILRALEARGLDVAPIAAAAGIDPTALGPDDRVTRDALNRLWALAVEATDDPAFGLQVARFTAQTTFHALGYAVLASSTLREAFERIIRYRRLIGDVLELRLSQAGDRYRFEIDVSSEPTVPFQAVDAIAAISARQSRMLRGCTPIRATFARPEPRDVEPYRRVLRAPVTFDADANALEFASTDFESPLPAGNAELARANDEVLVRYLARLQRSRTSARVQEALLDTLPNGPPSKPAIARALGMSARTLQRQLAAEGTSFTQVVDEARIALARTYVAESRLSVTEIAFVLGFADTSTFSRAFKRWTGSSPRDYRKGSLQD